MSRKRQKRGVQEEAKIEAEERPERGEKRRKKEATRKRQKWDDQDEAKSDQGEAIRKRRIGEPSQNELY